jgi:hypothetical protein
MSDGWLWTVLALLGAYHGLNPGMGWLFALALGLQEKRRSAVLGALVPIALGHAGAISVAVLAFRFVQNVLPPHLLKIVVAIILFLLASYRILRARHPRGAGMRAGKRDLFVWSFLMASVHGAGLMMLPVLLAQPGHSSLMTHAAAHTIGSPHLPTSILVLAVVVHTMSLLVIAGGLALLFYETYEKVGLKFLYHAWINFDLLWAIALLIAACLALLL